MIYFDEVQTSAQKLTRFSQQLIEDQFYTLVADLRSPAEAKQWLSDFLTETELNVFVKRLAIAQLLDRGKSYQDIKNQLKVSSATISSVSELVSKPGNKLAQKKLQLDQWAEHLVNKLFSLI